MTWLIDGSNLGGAIGGRAGARDAAAVVRTLQSWMRGRRERVVLVFDGEPDPRVAARYGALEVDWSGAGHAADDRIVALLGRLGRAASGTTVVTNDAELRRRCREAGARVESAVALLGRTETRTEPHPPPKRERLAGEEKPVPSRAEAERWAPLFQEARGADPVGKEGGAPLPRRRSTRNARSLAGLAFLLVLASCGDDRTYLPLAGSISAAEMARRPAIDACLLLLRSDVDRDGELELTKASNLLDEHEGPFFAKCSYGKRRPWRFVSLDLRRSLDAESASEVQRASRPFLRKLAHEPLVDVPAVGDAAVWAGGELDQLHVLSGDMRLIFTIEIGEDDGRQAKAIELAGLALERLRALGWERLIEPPPLTASGS